MCFLLFIDTEIDAYYKVFCLGNFGRQILSSILNDSVFCSMALEGFACIGNAFPECRLAARALFKSRLYCPWTVMLCLQWVFNMNQAFYRMQVSHGMHVSPSR